MRGGDPGVTNERVEMRLELIPLPTEDVERSKAFYADTIGFVVDHDVQPGPGVRIIQLTPPGSSCSIALMTGMGPDPGRQGRVHGLHLVVDDLEVVRSRLVARGAGVGEIRNLGGVRYASFNDPDGNSWELQEIPSRGDPD